LLGLMLVSPDDKAEVEDVGKLHAQKDPLGNQWE